MSKVLNLKNVLIFSLALLIILLLERTEFLLLRTSGFPVSPNFDLFFTYQQTRCSPNPCEHYVYSYVFYWLLHQISLEPHTLLIISLILKIFFSIILAVYIANLERTLPKLIMFAFFVSTPLQWLLMTMNLDILLIMLIFGAVYFQSRVKINYVLLLIATMIKYYPAIAFIPIYFFKPFWSNFRARKANLLILGGSLIFVLIEYSKNSGLRNMLVGPINAFGIENFWVWINYFSSYKEDSLAKLLIVSISYIGFTFLVLVCNSNPYIRIRIDEISSNLQEDLRRSFILKLNITYIVVGIFCFLTKNSFDYRLFFIVIPSAFLSLYYKSALLFVLTLNSTLFTQFTFAQKSVYVKWILQFWGDISITCLCALLVATLLRMVINNVYPSYKSIPSFFPKS